MSEPYGIVSMRLPKQFIKELDDLATKTKRTKTFFIKEALARYWEDVEDIYLAEQTILKIREGKGKIYSSAEMEKKLGLAN